MSSYFKQKLNEGEEPLLLLKQHGATFVWPVSRTIILALIPVPFINYVFQYDWLLLIVLVWWVIIVIWGLLAWFTWYFNITLVTSQRIVDIEQKGLFNRQVREVSYDKITEVTFKIKGLLATIFGYGTVSVFFTGADKPIVIQAIESPEIVKDQILKVREYVSSNDNQTQGMTAEELAKFIKQVRETNTAESKAEKIPVKVHHYNKNDQSD
ncbi:PH domain-containing protein [Patescibacteria group bacterium]